MLLSAREISKTFVKKVGLKKQYIKVLDGASLDIEEGKKVAILGNSGEGKSTFARILCGFCDCEGQVLLDGEDLIDKKGRYLRKKGVAIQIISQQPFSSLDPNQRVGKAVKEVFVARHIASKSASKILASQLFDEMRLDISLMDRLPSQLSAGQAQRVAIARALAVRPRLVILDEATSMLDVSSQAQILEIFNELAKGGLAVLFISHDEKLVYSFADSVYRMRDGKIVEDKNFKRQKQASELETRDNARIYDTKTHNDAKISDVGTVDNAVDVIE